MNTKNTSQQDEITILENRVEKLEELVILLYRVAYDVTVDKFHEHRQSNWGTHVGKLYHKDIRQIMRDLTDSHGMKDDPWNTFRKLY